MAQTEFMLYGRQEGGKNDPADKGQQKEPGQEKGDPKAFLEWDRCRASAAIQAVIKCECVPRYHDLPSNRRLFPYYEPESP